MQNNDLDGKSDEIKQHRESVLNVDEMSIDNGEKSRSNNAETEKRLKVIIVGDSHLN